VLGGGLDKACYQAVQTLHPTLLQRFLIPMLTINNPAMVHHKVVTRALFLLCLNSPSGNLDHPYKVLLRLVPLTLNLVLPFHTLILAYPPLREILCPLLLYLRQLLLFLPHLRIPITTLMTICLNRGNHRGHRPSSRTSGTR
jgi:hypothetical protein